MKLSLVILVAVAFILIATTTAESFYNKNRNYLAFSDEELDEYDYDSEIYDIDVPSLPNFEGNPRDAMQYYFGDAMNDDDENDELILSVRNAIKIDPTMKEHRDSRFSMLYGIDSEEYDQNAEKYRTSLLELASILDIPVNPYITSYFELLEECQEMYDVVAAAGNPNLLDLDNVYEVLLTLDGGIEFFNYSYTMLPVDVEEYILQGVVHIDGMIRWVKSWVSSNKCRVCKELVRWVKKKACGKAGAAVCKVIAGFAAPAISPIVMKFGCGAPLNLSGHLTNLCQKGVNWIQKKAGVTDTKICKSINFGTIRIPKHNGAIFVTSAHTITIGSLC
jgi:hypothetical protein